MEQRTSIAVGADFACYTEFETSLKELEKDQHVLYIKKDSKKVLDPSLADFLRYQMVLLECKHGASRKTQSKGIRANQRSLKLDCMSKIRVKLINEGSWKLRVVQADLDHSNHVPCKEAAAILPENRRIVVTDDVSSLLQCQSISNADLRAAINRQQKVLVLPKDIKNLKQKTKTSAGSGDIDLVDKVLRQVVEDGGRVDFGKNENGDFVYLVYQTRGMVEMLQNFPVVLIMDVTYKTNTYSLPLLTVMCMDKNGRGQPVLHGFLSCEATETLSHCLAFLKNSYESSKTSCFFVDKDFSEISSIESVFPEARVMLCAFHISTAVHKALSKKGLASGHIDAIFNLFMSMKEASTAARYEELKQEIIDLAPQEIVAYFATHWWSKGHLWAEHLHLESVRLNVTTTNHCESYHSKIKKFLHPQMPLNICISHLMDHDAQIHSCSLLHNLVNSNARHYNAQLNDPVINLIKTDVTRFAADYVCDQLLAIDKHDYYLDTLSSGGFQVSSSAGRKYVCCVDACECMFFMNFDLPCRHMFFLRREMSLPLYASVPQGHRFKNSAELTSVQAPSLFSCTDVQARRLTTPEAKFQQSSRLCNEVASYLSLLGEADFLNKYEQLDGLFSTWRGNAVDHNEEVRSNVVVDDAAENVADGAVTSEPVLDVDPQGADINGTSVVHFDSSRVESDLAERPTSPVFPSFSEPSSSDFSTVHINSVKYRGHPKNKQTFTSRKRKAIFPIKFADKSDDMKKALLIAGVVDDGAEAPFQIDDLKSTERLGVCLLDESVVNNNQDLFSDSAWEVLSERVREKIDCNLYVCNECKELDAGEFKMIQCDSCLEWYHYDCAEYRSKMRIKNWFCGHCW